MPRLNFKNNSFTFLAEAITDVQTSFTVVDASALPAVPFRVTLLDGASKSDAAVEIIEVGAKDTGTNVLSSVLRGREGTVAAAHASGNRMENRLTAATAIDYADKYGITTGAANTYAVALNPVLAAYVDGVGIAVKINVDNTGASTINVNSLGAKTIKKPNGNDVSAGNLKAGSIYSLRYNGTNFILQGSDAAGNATPGDVISGKTFSNDEGEQSGTLALTGDAALGDVLSAKTFYNTDAKTKRTGTFVPTVKENSKDTANNTTLTEGSSITVTVTVPAGGGRICGFGANFARTTGALRDSEFYIDGTLLGSGSVVHTHSRECAAGNRNVVLKNINPGSTQACVGAIVVVVG